MQSFAGVSGVTGGPWPAFTATDDPTPGVGTNLEASWVGDLFGFFQAIMAQTGPTVPDGSAEKYDASQLFDGLLNALYPPCCYFPLATDTIPAGARLLKCSGNVSTRSKWLVTYPRLIAGWCGAPTNATASAWYRVDFMGVRDVAGEYIVIPNMDGLFIRGADVGNAYDPSGSVRTYGDVQTDAMESHTHDHIYAGAGKEIKSRADGTLTAGTLDYLIEGGSSAATTGHVNTSAATSTETRPNNTVARWCVSY